MTAHFAALATLWVAVGSALGGVARYWVGIAVARFAGETFPYGTLLINVLGSFVIAYFGTMTLPDGPQPGGPLLRLFVMVGICGGFTTFSSFSFQTVALLRDGETISAALYIVGSVVLCLVATMIGHVLAQHGLRS